MYYMSYTYSNTPAWYAAYVITKHEKAVAEYCRQRAIEAFLPLYRDFRIWNRRRVALDLPLFPSYIFVKIDAKYRVRVLNLPGVVNIVTFNGVPTSVPEEQIRALRAAMELRHAEPHTYLASGTRVRIGKGSLAGLEGVVLRQNSVSKIVVSVDFICRSVAVELKPSDLECLQPVCDGFQFHQPIEHRPLLK